MVSSTLLQAPDPHQILMENYISIVEKTNQQLSVWGNPYGVMIGILTVLIAILAIVVTVALWKMGAEQKKRTDDFFEGLKEDNLKKQEAISEWQNKYTTQFDNLIQEYNEKLENLKKKNGKEDGKVEQLQKSINELKREKLSLGAYTIPEARPLNDLLTSSYLSDSTKIATCYDCSKQFKYRDKNDYLLRNYNKKEVRCPFCGVMNYV